MSVSYEFNIKNRRPSWRQWISYVVSREDANDCATRREGSRAGRGEEALTAPHDIITHPHSSHNIISYTVYIYFIIIILLYYRLQILHTTHGTWWMYDDNKLLYKYKLTIDNWRTTTWPRRKLKIQIKDLRSQISAFIGKHVRLHTRVLYPG